MLEPISTTVGLYCCLGYASLNAYNLKGSAVSAEAQALNSAASAFVRSVEESHALFGEKAAAITQLREMASECAEPGWDGDEAIPLNSIALENAENFIRALPESILMPEFAPEPDGSISLDWIQSRHRLFSLSIGQSNRLAYAWLDGTDKGHGVARFDGMCISNRLLAEIQSITGHDNASLRAA